MVRVRYGGRVVSVRYVRTVRWSGGDRGENNLTYTVTSVVSVTSVVTGDRRRGDRGENYLTYHVQATERTIRAYGTQKHRGGENYLTYRGL